MVAAISAAREGAKVTIIEHQNNSEKKSYLPETENVI